MRIHTEPNGLRWRMPDDGIAGSELECPWCGRWVLARVHAWCPGCSHDPNETRGACACFRCSADTNGRRSPAGRTP
jgi:hypothetical protein